MIPRLWDSSLVQLWNSCRRQLQGLGKTVFGVGLSHSESSLCIIPSVSVVTVLGSQSDGISSSSPPVATHRCSKSFLISSLLTIVFIVSSEDCAILCNLLVCTLGIRAESCVSPNPPSVVLEYNTASDVLGGRCGHCLTLLLIVKSNVSKYVNLMSE